MGAGFYVSCEEISPGEMLAGLCILKYPRQKMYYCCVGEIG
jgi:hypothetical protein